MSHSESCRILPNANSPPPERRGVFQSASRKLPSPASEFPGFPDFRANVTFVPLQFFTVVLPHRSRGCVRLVGYMIRRLLGWVDTDGNPTQARLEFSYRELRKEAGLSREAIAEAVAEALAHQMIECVRAPRPDRPGQPAQSGIYALRWSDVYTDAPVDFTGFFRREAVPGFADAEGRPLTHAKAARKNIPNAFFDYLLRRERLSLTRVVGVLLFRSIQWGAGGERKVPVCLSISELSRLTRRSRRHVHAAVQEAMSNGYVERVQEGCFDPRAGADSHAATYRIRWTASPVAPVYDVAPTPETPPVRKGERHPSEKGNGEAVGKGIRDQSVKGHGNRSEKGNDISIKRSIKNRTTAAEESKPSAAAADGILAKLRSVGFDASAAAQLASRCSAGVIEQQIAWLPQRKADTNRLGLLRRAIEGNWPRPEASVPPPDPSAGTLFVGHFEAALHGYTEPPARCSPREAAHATGFLRELARAVATEPPAAEWGRRFGLFARAKAPAKPWFVWVLRMYGGEFLRSCRQADRRDEKLSLAQSRQAHHEKFAARYDDYLRAIEDGLRREQPELYAAFAAERQETAARLHLSEKTQVMLASETGRLSALSVFLGEHGVRVLDFWAWDRELNRQGSPQTSTVPPASAEATIG